MKRKSLERIISVERLKPYLDRHNGKFESAIAHYRANIKISEAFYPLISILEIGLRNNMDQQLTQKYNVRFWFDSNDFQSLGGYFIHDRIKDAKRTLEKSKKDISAGRVISELTFGFWTALFDKRFERALWKDLRLVFPNCPKNIRQRKTISTKLNNIRKFRNRIFHHEPIFWNVDALNKYLLDLTDGISWLDSELEEWASELSRVEQVLSLEKKLINSK